MERGLEWALAELERLRNDIRRRVTVTDDDQLADWEVRVERIQQALVLPAAP